MEDNTTSKQETMDTAACNSSGGNEGWRRNKNNNRKRGEKMKKEDFIARRGEEAWDTALLQVQKWRRDHPEEVRKLNQEWYKEHSEEVKRASQEWQKAHPEEAKERKRLWALNNPEKRKESQKQYRKGGEHYEQLCEYESTGLRYERKLIRSKHGKRYRKYKKIIAPDSVLHHEWYPETANYTGVALVEKYQHQYGIIDVIQILEGKITLLTEAEIKNKSERQ